jgi:hypothetical protein
MLVASAVCAIASVVTKGSNEFLSDRLSEASVGLVGWAALKRPGDEPAKKDEPDYPPLLMLALASFFLLLGCCTPRGPVAWPKYVACAGEAVPDIVGIVGRILLSGQPDEYTLSEDGFHDLEGVAREHGAGVVACLVDRLIHDWTDPGKSQEPELVAAAQRGRSFLARVGTHTALED